MASPEAFVATFLLNALWQAPLIALLAALAARGLRDAPAACRHVVWVAALALATATPLRTALVTKPAPRPLSMPFASGAGGDAAARSGAARPFEAPLHASAPFTLAGGAWGRPLAALYLLFVSFQAVRLGRSWIATRRLARQVARDSAPPGLVERLAEAAGSVGRAGKRLGAIQLRVSDAVAGPITFGTRPAVVVLPTRFAAEAADDDLKGVLAHELAHVDRRDYRVNLMCEALYLPVAFHPAARLVRRRIAEAREIACDEAAAALVGTRRFGRTLLSLAAAGPSAARGPCPRRPRRGRPGGTHEPTPDEPAPDPVAGVADPEERRRPRADCGGAHGLVRGSGSRRRERRRARRHLEGRDVVGMGQGKARRGADDQDDRRSA